MTRKLFSTALSLLCFVLMLCALAATFGIQLLGDLKTYVQISLKNIEETTGYRITLDDIGWDIFEGTGIRADNLVLYDAAGATPVLECRKAHFKFDVLPLVKAKLIISRIILDDPLIKISRDGKGAWTQPPLPAPAETGSMSGLDAFTDFSISLKKFYINGGRVRFDDRLKNVRFDLEGIMLQVLRDKRSETYSLDFKANQPPEDGGSAAFAGLFQGIDAQGRLEQLTGSGKLTLKSAKLHRLVSYFCDNATEAGLRSSLNADLAVKLEPDWHFLLNGTMDCDNLTAPLPGGKLLPVGKTSFAGAARASSGLLLVENFKLTFADNATLSGKCSLTRMAESAGYLELKCSSNRIRVTTLAKLAAPFEALPTQVRAILANTRRGEIALADAHILTNLGNMPAESHSTLTGRLHINDVVSHFSPKFPPLRISHATMNLHDDESLEAELAAQWPGTDNHTLHAKVESIFHGPQITLQADSVLCADGVSDILKIAAPELAEKISMDSGFIAAKTQITYSQEAAVSAAIDLQQASVTALDVVNKPEGVPMRLELKTTVTPAAGPPLPLSFTVTGGDALSLEGKVKSWEPFACSGAYRADNFDFSTFEIVDLKGLAEVSGRLSGSGDWELPLSDAELFPVLGTCTLMNFALVSTSTGKLLVGGTIDGAFENTGLKILSCRGAMGETAGTLSGRMTSLLPPRGRVDIVADMFDIDDFVNVIDNITSINDHIKLRKKEPATPPRTPDMLMQADMDMPLTIKRVNLWNWDLDNGTSIWTLKKGVMHWDNVTLIGGGGPITGTVMFDLSKIPVRTLTLSPSKSQSDFLFVVPALRKNRTITGAMDMKGWFSSTFSRKEELGRNMNGKFHIDVADGKIQKLTILSKILELMDLGNWFSFMTNDIFSTGMPFDSIKADFTIDHAVMKTENLQLKGPAMNLSAVGTINMATENMNLIIGAQILETFGKIVGAIPLAGGIVTGKDKTITLAYFSATGSYQNASVMPMPIKSLSAPFLKLINSFLYFPKKLLSTASGPDNTSNASAP